MWKWAGPEQNTGLWNMPRVTFCCSIQWSVDDPSYITCWRNGTTVPLGFCTHTDFILDQKSMAMFKLNVNVAEIFFFFLSNVFVDGHYLIWSGSSSIQVFHCFVLYISYNFPYIDVLYIHTFLSAAFTPFIIRSFLRGSIFQNSKGRVTQIPDLF